MSKYNKFEDFMQVVINEADNKCHRRYNKSLAEAYNVNINTTNMILAVISHGWWVFLALAALLGLGGIAFGISLAAFITSPPGIIVVAALALVGGVAAIRTLYRNKVLPMAVRDTGVQFKERFENHLNNESYIDSLIDEASDCLLDKATDIGRY